jgi:hypothetical protein
MASEASSLVLEHLRHIRTVVDETREDVKRLVLRTGLIEQNFATSQVSEAGQTGDRPDQGKIEPDRATS